MATALPAIWYFKYNTMRKLFILLMVFGIACSNPEDRATGDPDSERFNESEKVLNSRPGPTDPNSPMNGGSADTADLTTPDRETLNRQDSTAR